MPVSADGTGTELILRFSVALAIGLVVGLERGWRTRSDPAGSRTAGIRTFALLGLLGAVAAALAQAFANPLPLAAILLAASAAFAWFKSREAAAEQSFSITGVVAAMAVLALGALAVAGNVQAAAAGGVATAGLLAARERLHGLLARLSWEEVRSALLLLAMTVVVLPLLPNRPLDPWGGTNPREIWLFALLTAAISFVGYVAVRITGPQRGILIGGLAGALVSSTAVTLAFARKAAVGERAELLAGGAALAGLVSLARVTTIISVVAPPVLPYMVAPAAAAGLVFGLAGAWLILRSKEAVAAATEKLANPLDLRALMLFAGSFAAVSLLAGWLVARAGSSGLLGAAALFGMMDVDVATLTAARAPVMATEAADAVLLALLVNGSARAIMGMMAGPWSFSARLGAATLSAAGVGALVLLVA